MAPLNWNLHVYILLRSEPRLICLLVVRPRLDASRGQVLRIAVGEPSSRLHQLDQSSEPLIMADYKVIMSSTCLKPFAPVLMILDDFDMFRKITFVAAGDRNSEPTIILQKLSGATNS